MTDEAALDESEFDVATRLAEDEPDLDDADLPSDEEEDADPPPRDATVAPADPDADDAAAGEEI